MRTVSFVERLEFEYQGNIFSSAIALGDIDNDQLNELIVGNVHGNLIVYKDKNLRPWRTCSDLGMITCVSVGDICNHGKKYLVTISAEGWCHIFHTKSQPEDTKEAEEDGEKLMKPAYRQHLPANSKAMLIADVDGDGKAELVIGYSDRVVRSFRWQESIDSDASPSLSSGKFVSLEKWQLAGQIGSITVNRQADGSSDLMVAQPGGTFVSLKGSQESETYDNGEKIDGPSLIYHPLGSSRLRNPGVTTEVVGNINRTKHSEDEVCEEGLKDQYYALCTLDGTLMLVDDDKIVWSMQVDHQLFALTKLDVTGDGTEEVVVSSWDGQTYIVNHNREVVRFTFEEHVAAFCAGPFAVDGENKACFVYATFNNQLCLYYNMQMSEVGSTDLIKVMEKKADVNDLLTYIGVDACQPSQVRQLYHWCLYGQIAKSS